MYMTKLDPEVIARASIDRKKALMAAWDQGDASMTETKRPVIGR